MLKHPKIILDNPIGLIVKVFGLLSGHRAQLLDNPAPSRRVVILPGFGGGLTGVLPAEVSRMIP